MTERRSANATLNYSPQLLTFSLGLPSSPTFTTYFSHHLPIAPPSLYFVPRPISRHLPKFLPPPSTTLYSYPRFSNVPNVITENLILWYQGNLSPFARDRLHVLCNRNQSIRDCPVYIYIFEYPKQ